MIDEQYFNAPLGSDSEHTSSDHAFTGDFFINIPDADSITTDDELSCGVENGKTIID